MIKRPGNPYGYIMKSESEPVDSIREKVVEQVSPTIRQSREDVVAVEEPMEIRVVFGAAGARKDRSLAVTMRTPGHDEELAAGFLFTEGIVQNSDQLVRFERCGPVAEGQAVANTIRVELAEGFELRMQDLQRHFYTTSSCGVCGKGSIDAVRHLGLSRLSDDAACSRRAIFEMPDRLRDAQTVFQRTGGLHATGLFDAAGSLVLQREDVGRHNAMDKLIGHQFLKDRLPLGRQVLVVSGRASFELVQKAIAAGVPILVAVGAPSSLAIELATEFNLTLIGFTSRQRFNVYSSRHRIDD